MWGKNTSFLYNCMFESHVLPWAWLVSGFPSTANCCHVMLSYYCHVVISCSHGWGGGRLVIPPSPTLVGLVPHGTTRHMLWWHFTWHKSCVTWMLYHVMSDVMWHFHDMSHYFTCHMSWNRDFTQHGTFMLSCYVMLSWYVMLCHDVMLLCYVIICNLFMLCHVVMLWHVIL